MLNTEEMAVQKEEKGNLKGDSQISLIAGSLESANWSILAAHNLFKEVVGKNQDFMLMRFLNVSNLIGCGGDP